jgi:hypothetical protein
MEKKSSRRRRQLIVGQLLKIHLSNKELRKEHFMVIIEMIIEL